MSSSLTDFGWTPAFASAFSAQGEETQEPARVTEEQRSLFRVRSGRGELVAEVTGRLRHHAAGPEELPAVGDWVVIDAPAVGRARIVGVLPRTSALLRKSADRTSAAQVMAANLDTVFLVTSLNRDFNPRRIERFLTLIWEGGAQPVLLLNKADLCDDVAARTVEAEAVAPAVPVHALSAQDGAGVEALAPYLAPGRTTALIGSSGVGKSTLINRLAGAELQLVRQIRVDDDRGRHTTTSRQLLRLESGALLIDTPGLREVALLDGADGIRDAFEDIETLAAECRFRDCKHKSEPGCAVREAIAIGTLDADRYESYGKLKRELERFDLRQQLAHKRQQKVFARMRRRLDRR